MRELALKGLKWSFLQQFLSQIVNYSSVLYLAAKVVPELHGLITISSIPGGFIGILGTLGIREKITKEKLLNSDDQAGYLGFILMASLIIFILTLALSVAVAFFYAHQFNFNILFKTAVLLSLIPSLGLLNNYFEALQYRKFEFKIASLIGIWSIFIGSGIAMILAFFGQGYLALVIKLIGPHICILFAWVYFSRRNLQFTWKPTLYAGFKNFSTFYTFNSIANYFVRNSDYIIIGKFFPAKILGQYTIAYKILLFPMKNITSNIQGVMLRVLSKLDFESNRFKERFFLVVSFIAFLVFPMMAFVSVSAGEWVKLAFNSSYTEIKSMIVLLSIVGAFQAVTSPVGVLYILKEKTRIMFNNSLIIASLIIVTFLFSSIYFSIYWVVLSYTIVWLLLVMPLTVSVAYKIFNFSFSDFIKSVYPSVVSTVLAGLSYFIIKSFLLTTPVACLLIGSFLFIAIYFACYHFMSRKTSNSIAYFLQFLKKKK